MFRVPASLFASLQEPDRKNWWEEKVAFSASRTPTPLHISVDIPRHVTGSGNCRCGAHASCTVWMSERLRARRKKTPGPSNQHPCVIWGLPKIRTPNIDPPNRRIPLLIIRTPIRYPNFGNPPFLCSTPDGDSWQAEANHATASATIRRYGAPTPHGARARARIFSKRPPREQVRKLAGSSRRMAAASTGTSAVPWSTRAVAFTFVPSTCWGKHAHACRLLPRQRSGLDLGGGGIWLRNAIVGPFSGRFRIVIV